MIRCENVNYAYPQMQGSVFDETPAHVPVIQHLQDINLQIDAGTLTLLVGPSGSGKSTLLRTFNGLIPHFFDGEFTGSVRVSGKDIAAEPLHDVGRSSAMVFQNPRTQFFTSYVDTELAFGLENYAVAPSQVRTRITEAAKDAGITHLLGRQLDTLSGGELQRVACACALVAGVELLLFDEPTANLSPQAVNDFAALVAELRQKGTTLVIAEHRLYPFRGITDRVVRMSGGKIVAEVDGPSFYALDDAQRRELGLRRLRLPDQHPGTNGSADNDTAVPAQPDLTSAATANTHPGASGPQNPGLHIANLRFSYPHGPRVLDIPSLYFPAGAVTVIAGENGVGKSTLARIICGLERPGRDARISINGRAVHTAERLRRCGMVMQDVRRQLFSAAVSEEVRLGLPLADEAVLDLLGRLDLAQFADRHPLSLSGGQAQRLVVAALVAAEDEVVIFDEPTSGVDYEHLRLIAELVRELARQGRIVVVITHDAELIEACADKVFTLTPPKVERRKEITACND